MHVASRIDKTTFSPVLHVFEVKESIFLIFTEAAMFTWPRKSRSTSGFTGPQGYWWLGQKHGFLKFLHSPTFSRSRNLVFVVSQSYYVRVTSKIQVNFRLNRCSRVLMIGSHGFFVISLFPTFSRSRNPFFIVSQSYYVRSNLENPDQLPGLTGPQGYWWLGLMVFQNFFIPHVFEVKESGFRSFTKLLCLCNLDKSRSTSGFAGPQGYWWLGLMVFRNFFIPHVFEVKEWFS